MKRIITILLIAFCIQSNYGQGTLKVKVIDTKTEAKCINCNVKLIELELSQLTDSNGICTFKMIDSGLYSISIISEFDSLKISEINVQNKQITWLSSDLTVYCQYKKSKHDNICPICHKNDKVLKITYGFMDFENKKDLKEYNKKYYNGGCNISKCDPNWYCKRNKLKF